MTVNSQLCACRGIHMHNYTVPYLIQTAPVVSSMKQAYIFLSSLSYSNKHLFLILPQYESDIPWTFIYIMSNFYKVF